MNRTQPGLVGGGLIQKDACYRRKIQVFWGVTASALIASVISHGRVPATNLCPPWIGRHHDQSNIQRNQNVIGHQLFRRGDLSHLKADSLSTKINTSAPIFWATCKPNPVTRGGFPTRATAGFPMFSERMYVTTLVAS